MIPSLVLKRNKILITLLIMVSIVSCKNNSYEQRDLTLILQTSFEHIYLAKHGLEYPYTEEQLKICIEHKNKPCLDAYYNVINGEKTITSLSNNNSLDTTLNIIESSCADKNADTANYICYGGIMSLFFYNSNEQDAKILKRIKNYPKKIQSLVFNEEFYWFRNRPDVSEWISYINEADIKLINGNKKHFIIALFRKSIKEDTQSPWVLR